MSDGYRTCSEQQAVYHRFMENQTAFRASARTAFSILSRNAQAVITALDGLNEVLYRQPLPLYSRYTLGEKELRRDRRLYPRDRR